MYDFILNFKIKQNGLSPKVIFQTPSPLRGTPSINRGRAGILPVFGKSHQLLLCLLRRWHEVTEEFFEIK